MMSAYLAAILIIAISSVFIWIRWYEKGKWETVAEAFGNQSKELQSKYHYLMRQGISCRLKNYTPVTIRMKGSQGGQGSLQNTIQLQVNKKEIDQAYRHLSDFNQL